MSSPSVDLSALFRSVEMTLAQARDELNQMDAENHNHGDHMVEVFQIARRAADEKQSAELAEAVGYAGELLAERPQNGSAQVYGRGLNCLAEEFRRREITREELFSCVRAYIHKGEGQSDEGEEAEARKGEVTKALLLALAQWGQGESGKPDSRGGLDLGSLFGMGMAYLQARSLGGSQVEILAETAISSSPLGRISHRRSSGKLVLISLLQALEGDAP